VDKAYKLTMNALYGKFEREGNTMIYAEDVNEALRVWNRLAGAPWDLPETETGRAVIRYFFLELEKHGWRIEPPTR
jgi:hypothetical protein